MQFRALGFAIIASALADQAVAQDDPPTLTASIPLEVSDLTRDVYGIGVDCFAMSAAGDTVASGGTYLIETEVYNSQSDAYEEITAEEIDSIMPSDLATLEAGETIEVKMYQRAGKQIDAWVTGRCELRISHGTPPNSVVESSAARVCDSNNGDNIAICAWPGSELVSEVTFVRPGLNADGTPEALPGVD